MANFEWKSDPSRPTLSEKFIFSPQQRPLLAEVRSPESVPLPIVDLGGADEGEIVHKIARASEEFGFFRIINHGVPEPVWRRAAESVRDLFLLPAEVKALFPGEGAGLDLDAVKLFTYYNNDWEDRRKVYMWSEVVNHLWHPTDDFTAGFPTHIGAAYREHIVAYSKEMGVLMKRLLSLLSKGLGLEEDYLKRRLGEQPYYKCSGNYYPPCPIPELTIGLPIHSDSLALSIVRTLDNVPGLQILKGQDWVSVGQHANSFIINIGDQLQVLSNKRYKSVDHRVVNNESCARVTMAYFWGPGLDQTIGPIEELVDDDHPPMYNSYKYKDFVTGYSKMAGKRRDVKKLYECVPNLE